MITGIKDILGIVIGAVLAAGIYFVANHLIFYPQQREIGRESYIAEQAVKDVKNQMERKNDDAKLRGLSDYDICIAYVGKLPECESLKL